MSRSQSRGGSRLAAAAAVVAALAAGLLAGFVLGRAGRAPADERGPSASAASTRAPRLEDELRQLAQLGYAHGYVESASDPGVQVLRAEACAPGLNLVVSAHAPEAVLMDLEGQVRHRWAKRFPELFPEAWRERTQGRADLEEPSWRHVTLLPGGRLLAIWEPYGLALLEPDSTPVWALQGSFHHALDVLDDGTIWVLTREAHVVPRIHPERPILEGFLTHLDADGRSLGSFSLLRAFERSVFAPTLARTAPHGDLFHTNSVQVLEGELDHLGPPFTRGHALLSLREIDTVAIVDLAAREVVWTLSGLWRRQHDARIEPDGHLTVFDNVGLAGKSRVLELDPRSQRIAWSYDGSGIGGLDSPLCGMSRKLDNGNVLITESLPGRAVEVDRRGQVVWLWQSPHRTPSGEVAVLMQVERVPFERLDWLPPGAR